MFDLEFDPPGGRPRPATVEVEAPPPEPEPEPEPPPPTYSAEDLDLVRDAAHAEGMRLGRAEAAQATERMEAEALSRLAEAMAGLHQAEAASADEARRVAAQVAMAVLRKILPAACETHGFEEVVRMVEECFAHVLDEPRIIVRVAAAIVDPVRERLDPLASLHGFEGRVVVQADPRLAVGDCRVEWADGGAERDQARLIADIEAAVARALAPPERGSEAP